MEQESTEPKSNGFSMDRRVRREWPPACSGGVSNSARDVRARERDQIKAQNDEGAEEAMGGAVDKAKGRVKEAAGALADDDELKREGKIDQAAGKVKDAVGKVVDKVKKAAKGERRR